MGLWTRKLRKKLKREKELAEPKISCLPDSVMRFFPRAIIKEKLKEKRGEKKAIRHGDIRESTTHGPRCQSYEARRKD